MLAIMGPSGAGKTSLLNCLSMRNRAYRREIPRGRAVLFCTLLYPRERSVAMPSLSPKYLFALRPAARLLNLVQRGQALDVGFHCLPWCVPCSATCVLFRWRCLGTVFPVCCAVLYSRHLFVCVTARVALRIGDAVPRDSRIGFSDRRRAHKTCACDSPF